MTKPTTTYTWDTAGTNVTQPSAGLRLSGYATDDIPTSAHYNYQMNSIYQWLAYLEATTDALSTVTGTGDINIICDNDSTSTTNAIYFKHNSGATELAKIDESANFLLNQATVGTSGAGVIAMFTGTEPASQPADEVQIYSKDHAAADARLYVKTEAGGTISIGNDSIRNQNTDGTFLIASEKHLILGLDSDNDGTDAVLTIRKDGTTALVTVDESANLMVNTASVGTSGTGVVGIFTGTEPASQPADEVQLYSKDHTAGDARLYVKTESGGTISIGNNAIRNQNSDGTLIVASEKHVTVDIDSDADGTDGLFTVRANGSTAAMTVSEVGDVVATGAVTGTNVLSTNITDQLALAVSALTAKATTWNVFTDAEVTTMVGYAGGSGNWIRDASGASGTTLVAIGTNSDIVTLAVPGNGGLTTGAAWASKSVAVDYTSVDADGTFGVGCAATGAIYTSPASGDYATWTSRTSGTGNNLSFITVGGGYWCAFGGSNNNTIRYNDTTDPTDAWSGSTSGLDGTTTFVGAAYGAGLHVAITSDHEIITTANPSSSWTQRTNPTTGAWRGMSFDGTRFWAWANASGKMISSTDGITWTDVSVSGAVILAGGCTLAAGSQKIYLAFESLTGAINGESSIWYGTTLGTWSKLSVDLVQFSNSATVRHTTYLQALKRLFAIDINSDLAFSSRIL